MNRYDVIKDDLSALVKLLGEDNVIKVQDALTEMLIENIGESIKEEYIMLPIDIEDEYKSIVKEESDKLLKACRKEIRDALKVKYAEWVEQLKEQNK